MNKLHYLLLFFLIYSCSTEAKKEKAVRFSSFKEKLSYVLGVDHARSISESGDKNFPSYNKEEILNGFKIGMKDIKAFDKECQQTFVQLFGNDGKSFNPTYAKEGSLCLGKLSGAFFKSGWEHKNAKELINYKFVQKGFEDQINGKDSVVPRKEQVSIIQNFILDLNQLNGKTMLEKASKNKNNIQSKSGLVIETLREGKGGKPQAGDDILAHYILMNALGDTLQDSYKMTKELNQKLTPFSLLSVVPGWQEGIPMMNKGGKYKLYLPFHLAYGDQGMFNPQTQRHDIQPYESLQFIIELLDYGKPGTVKSIH
ncbi:MAG: FKBP-type peptidyl-prolyl cis-trans isomerase [Flavobacteriia bacterium]|nr:FKBP-type peptidyl-prolyl cis-trans isomerase [Flavobacteriia bacterium]